MRIRDCAKQVDQGCLLTPDAFFAETQTSTPKFLKRELLTNEGTVFATVT
jgi:hypothetical protein